MHVTGKQTDEIKGALDRLLEPPRGQVGTKIHVHTLQNTKHYPTVYLLATGTTGTSHPVLCGGHPVTFDLRSLISSPAEEIFYSAFFLIETEGQENATRKATVRHAVLVLSTPSAGLRHTHE